MAILDNGVEELTAGQQIVFAHTANNVTGVLAVACGSSDTTISLSPGGGALFPNAPFYCSIEFEVLWCLSKSGDNLIVQRGQDGTTSGAHPAGTSVEMRNNAGLWSDAYNGINAVSADVGTLQTNILNKTALPPDTTFNNATQELTHKTLDLADSSKQNVIIGNVQPDPAALVYQNILINGGFDDWSYPTSTTLAAGTPTSGFRQAYFANGWIAFGYNDSAITAARDTANTDPGYPSGVDCLINVSTVQGADVVGVYQTFNAGIEIGPNDLLKVVNNPFSISARVKFVSGNVQVRFHYIYGDPGAHQIVGPLTQVAAGYNTIKFENQLVVPNINVSSFSIYIEFQGVGVVALDNVMLILGPVATTHRPSFPSITNNRLAPNVQRANLLTNGGFEIWQRGNGPFTTGFGPDRWQLWNGGASSISVSRDAAHAYVRGYCAAVVIVGAASPANPAQMYQYPITYTDAPILSGRTVTFSAKIISTTPSTLRIGIGEQGGVTNRSAYHSGSGGYETVSCSVAISAGLSGIVLQVYLSCEAPGTYYIDDAMLIIGSAPAEFVPMHPADDLARCLRYYEGLQMKPYSAYGIAGMSWDLPIFWGVRKATSPTLTKITSMGVFNCSVAMGYNHTEGCSITGVVTSAARFGLGAVGGYDFTVEANP